MCPEAMKCILKYGQDLQHGITQGASELNGNMDAERSGWA